MDVHEKDDFDDFFDTPGRSVLESTDIDLPEEKTEASKTSPERSVKSASVKKGDPKSDSGDRRRSRSPDYSSDSVTESDSDSKMHRRRKSSSRSRSRSSRSESNSDYSSDSSRSRERDAKRRDRRSSSRSSRSSSNDSRTATPGSVARGKRKSKRRDSYSSVTSSSSTSHSDSKNSDRRSPRPKSRRDDQKQAWGMEVKITDKRPERPKTAKHRSSDDKYAKGDYSRRRERNGKRDSRDSDSDMTDVSPILSPRNGSMNGHSKAGGDRYYGSNPNKFQAMPIHDDDSQRRQLYDGGDHEALDLNILMKAVSELEKQKRVQANTRRVMFEPLRAKPREKSNYTFTNDDTHRIDAENKRLLNQIMQQMHPGEEKRPKGSDIRMKQAVITPSAINRRRAQQKIENENLSFLRRLQKVRATKGLSRNEQLSAYNTTVLHGIPIAAIHPTKTGGRRSGRQSSASSVAGSLGRSRSVSSLHSAATASSFGTASRQSSRAGSRPSSAKKNIQERPAWNDRWN